MPGLRSKTIKQESPSPERLARGKAILAVLQELFPEASIALSFGSSWELYVAVALSAQCTDKMVNQITATLFKKYRTIDDYCRADFDEFAQDIFRSGFYRVKAKNILAAARLVAEKHDGVLPCTMQELLALPGIARKTANVILGNVCGVVEGIAVDTHVKRFAQKLDLSDYADPVRIERDLMQLFPREEWFALTYRLIEYGRQICPARKHECAEHPLSKLYPKAASIWPRAK